MGVGSGLYMYDVVVKRSRSLSHLLMSSCKNWVTTTTGGGCCSLAVASDSVPLSWIQGFLQAYSQG